MDIAAEIGNGLSWGVQKYIHTFIMHSFGGYLTPCALPNLSAIFHPSRLKATELTYFLLFGRIS